MKSQSVSDVLLKCDAYELRMRSCDACRYVNIALIYTVYNVCKSCNHHENRYWIFRVTVQLHADLAMVCMAQANFIFVISVQNPTRNKF